MDSYEENHAVIYFKIPFGGGYKGLFPLKINIDFTKTTLYTFSIISICKIVNYSTRPISVVICNIPWTIQSYKTDTFGKR